MSKIIRYEFMGSWLFFWLLCITVILIPVAILYLLSGTLRIEDEMTDPEQFRFCVPSSEAELIIRVGLPCHGTLLADCVQRTALKCRAKSSDLEGGLDQAMPANSCAAGGLSLCGRSGRARRRRAPILSPIVAG